MLKGKIRQMQRTFLDGKLFLNTKETSCCSQYINIVESVVVYCPQIPSDFEINHFSFKCHFFVLFSVLFFIINLL